MEFLKCKKCGNIVEVLYDSGVPIYCCEEPMLKLKSNQFENLADKHIPVCKINGKVLHIEIGKMIHPMIKEHLIECIIVKNGSKTIKVQFDENCLPIADIIIDPTKPIEVYDFCNLHGLWVAKF